VLGPLPVVLLRAELAKLGEGVRVIGPRLERRLEGLARPGCVADLGQKVAALHLHGHPLFRVGDGRDAPFEQRGQIVASAA
jgi:hypothetical protein